MKRFALVLGQTVLAIITVVAFWRAYDAIVYGPSGSGSAMTASVRYAEGAAAVGILSLAALLFSLVIFR